MTVAACIVQLRSQGQLDAQRAQLFMETFQQLEAGYRPHMGAAAAAAQASAATMNAMALQLARKKRLTALQISSQKQILTHLANGTGAGLDPGTVAIAMLSPDARVPGVPNLELRHEAILSSAWAKMHGVFERFDRLPFVGVRNPAGLEDVARAAFGETPSNPWAQQLAEAWAETSEYLRQRFNMHGGKIGKLENWGMPTRWDPLRVRQASYEEFRDAIVPELDLARMIDERTGQPFTPFGLESFLRDTYEAIRSNGWSRQAPGSMAGRGMMGNGRAEHRFLRFESFDGWMRVQARFGVVQQPADIYNLMMGHIDGMAREIAAMEIFGPNPDATLRWLTDLIEKDAAVSSAAGKAFEKTLDGRISAAAQISNMWGMFTGRVNIPVKQGLARGFAAARSILTSAMLGSAAISAATDIAFGKSTRLFNGLPQTGLIREYLQWMAPMGAAEKKALARETGIMARQAASMLSTLWRYTEEANVPGWAQRVASGVLDVSLLSRWTEVGRAIMGMELQRALARESGKGWASLDPAFRGLLERYGIGESRWNMLRQVPQRQVDGLGYLTPDTVAEQTSLPPGEADALATALWELIAGETRMAVPDAPLRARAVMRGDRRPGTWVNELVNSAFQFKAFPVGLLFTQWQRAFFGRGAWPRWAHAAHLLALTTLFGAVAQQMLEIVNGKDPRPMDDPRFWMAAMQRGGGLGIYGDFLFADQTRNGATATETMAGPLIGTGSRAVKATVGNAQKALQGKDATPAKDTLKVIRSVTPGANLWYSRLAGDRLFWDELNRLADPDYEASIRRMERRAAREFGQGFWWEPDENLPDRAPDFSNAMGDDQ